MLVDYNDSVITTNNLQRTTELPYESRRNQQQIMVRAVTCKINKERRQEVIIFKCHISCTVQPFM